jgi:Ca-activated chloride channel family protein
MFSRPLCLLIAILALVFLIVLYRIAERRRCVQAITYSHLGFMLAALRPPRAPERVFFTVSFLGATLLALAFGGVRTHMRVPVKDATVLLCIDTSGSMQTHDLPPSRARAAEAAARRFIEEVPGGTHVGILTFATSALLIQPPSDDLDAVKESLTRVPAPNGATAIGDALTLANEQMPAHGRRVVLLLTDGVNNRGADPIAAAQALGRRGILVSTVGIGSGDADAFIPGTNERAALNDDGLLAIAQNAGGSYARVRNASTLRKAFDDFADTTVWEKRPVDMSLPASLVGGALMGSALLLGAALGRIP